MELLANLKLRKKLLVALTPLGIMTIFAGLYASFQAQRIDTLHSQLIDNEIKAVHNIDVARALTVRYGDYLYRLTVETDVDRIRLIETELNDCYAEYKTRTADASTYAVTMIMQGGEDNSDALQSLSGIATRLSLYLD